MNKKSGFTLIELSIVLVIISLIAAGVVSGREMIHTSRLSALASDYLKYQTAFNMFELKYDQVPGDFNEATSYWPGVSRNGNNDGTYSNSLERTSFFDHLAHAGLTEGIYDHTESSIIIGTSRPASPFDGIAIDMEYLSAIYYFTGDAAAADYPADIILTLRYNNSGSRDTLTPEDTKFIDKKLDNGLPGSGKLIGYSSSDTCANNHSLATLATDTYDVSVTTKVCSPWFILG